MFHSTHLINEQSERVDVRRLSGQATSQPLRCHPIAAASCRTSIWFLTTASDVCFDAGKTEITQDGPLAVVDEYIQLWAQQRRGQAVLCQ
jgi:hypothetical protein